ncbi:hypothetical protein MPTK1_2g00250 [Marchantia polymorpha subsp. ruderalis]|uniref:Uncharacterized protein n=1 Tax=Marchantia polymorpha TaxID=3197 RepID=A0A2R6X9R3_MARPO|nr:hypothetical protein MARPO_0028s0126 [Marchantia polymorpha]BBN00563.1 hypothetical protein Mp_2g00250 [Marchantia polymorpha subsp. ruderalis]|eukprot:PTQ42834.1 hypothetical protein MARPO_0028s0126 [Marchantia polymorpha]
MSVRSSTVESMFVRSPQKKEREREGTDVDDDPESLAECHWTDPTSGGRVQQIGGIGCSSAGQHLERLTALARFVSSVQVDGYPHAPENSPLCSSLVSTIEQANNTKTADIHEDEIVHEL